MKTKLIKIGNSQGIRIPLQLIELVHLEEDIELIPEKGKIIIQNVHKPRSNWDQSFSKMSANGDDTLVDSHFISTSWDDKEWEW